MNRHIRGLGSITVLVVTFSACAAPEPEDTSAADLEAINGLRDAWLGAFNSGDAEALGALYATDAVVMNPGEPTISGQPSIQAMYEATFAQMSMQAEVRPEATEVDGDLAFDAGTFISTATPVEGGDAIAEEGRYLVIARRDADGTWKVLREMGNRPTPSMTGGGM
jgi:uncharacterized protein (TIGR02246 family)